MISEAVQALIVAQTEREARARSIYLSLSLWCNLAGYDGAQAYFRKSSEDEGEHLGKFLDFLADYTDFQCPVPAVDVQNLGPASLMDAFSEALALEQTVTTAINGIARAADEEEDAQEVEAFLQWFLLEQIASVSEIRTILRWLQRAGDDTAALFSADEKIGELVEG